MKTTLAAIAVLSVGVVAASAYFAWLNVLEERQTRRLQPMLGVVYQKQRR